MFCRLLRTSNAEFSNHQQVEVYKFKNNERHESPVKRRKFCEHLFVVLLWLFEFCFLMDETAEQNWSVTAERNGSFCLALDSFGRHFSFSCRKFFVLKLLVAFTYLFKNKRFHKRHCTRLGSCENAWSRAWRFVQYRWGVWNSTEHFPLRILRHRAWKKETDDEEKANQTGLSLYCFSSNSLHESKYATSDGQIPKCRQISLKFRPSTIRSIWCGRSIDWSIDWFALHLCYCFLVTSPSYRNGNLTASRRTG